MSFSNLGSTGKAALSEASGVDLTRLPGIDTGTAFKVIIETSIDMSGFKSVKHFISWMGLCPGTKISGGKLLSSATQRSVNGAAQALRKSQSALGAYLS